MPIEQVGQQFQSRLAGAKANASLFAGSEMLSRYLLTSDERVRYEVLQYSLIRLFYSYEQVFPEYYEIRVLLPDGYEDTRVVNPPLRDTAEDESQTAYFRALREAKEDPFTTVFRNPDNDQWALLVSKAIYVTDRIVAPVAARPEIKGYLAITVSLSFLADQIEHTRIGKAGSLFVTDTRGAPLFLPTRMNSDVVTRLRGDGPKLLDGSVRVGEFQGERFFVMGQPLTPDLEIFALLPEAEFAEASRRLALSVGAITLAAIALTTWLLFVMLRSLVIRPVKQLGEAAQAVGRGEFPTQLQIRRQDEIGDLAHAFLEMSSNLRRSSEQVRRLAFLDSLTGLPNRRMFLEFLDHSLKEAARAGETLAILFLDLDNFKQVNDTMGHDAGDRLLVEVVARLKECVRAADYLARPAPGIADPALARLGGDEFVVLLEHLHDAQEAAPVAKRIIVRLTEPVLLQQQVFHVGVSIGLTCYPRDAQDVESLIKNADIAMYAAKQQGKNTYRFYRDDMRVAAVQRLALENALRTAVEREEFVLHYQPQVDTRSGSIVGVEALVRWQHPERGLVPPQAFIAVAEQTGMIEPLGAWVLAEACRQARRWQTDGLPVARMAVNISRRQFQQNLAALVERTLTSSGLGPETLELEITETSVMEAHHSAVETLRTLKTVGLQLAMDDFGTGYSSLGALRSFPIDTLKIDRSFVKSIEREGRDKAIIGAVIAMARRLNLRTIAEGVETRRQLDCLGDEGCHLVQGYLLSRPVSAAAMGKLLAGAEPLRPTPFRPGRLEALRSGWNG
jgi:diguanylate cyclase (GGDEF)-like protein